MTLRIRDVIDIPPTKPPLVVKVGEINDEERQAVHALEGAQGDRHFSSAGHLDALQ